MKGYYSVFKSSSNGEYYFNLHADNNQKILHSEGYTTKQMAFNGIASVQEHSPFDKYYERLTSTSNQPYFVLKASNGKVIGVSEMYNSVQARENGIASVKVNGSTTDIRDNT